MKNTNKFLIFAVLILGIFLISQFFDFRLTGKITTETVESTSDVGKYSSIAIDSNNKVHISHHFDFGNNIDFELRYCNNTAGSWSCTDVESTNDVGKYSSIAIDSNNKVHISHQEVDDGTGVISLRYCNNTAGSWSCAYAETNNPDDLGFYSSIAIDSNDKIHISHVNFTVGSNSLRYCNDTQGSWSCEVVAKPCTSSAECLSGESCGPSSLCIGDKGQYSSIALDSNDIVHISEYINSTDDLRYCNNTAGSWSCTNVESFGGQYTSIAIDSNNKIHISHFESILGGSLRYCNNTAGSWSCAKVDTRAAGGSEFTCTNSNECFSDENCLDGLCVPVVGQYSSIAIDSNDKIHISHYDVLNDDLRYCNNINGTFVCKKLADADADVLGSLNGRALALKKGRIVDSTSFSGEVHISWYNNTDLMYTSVDPFEPTASAVCSPGIVTLGDAFPCSCSGSDSSSGGVTISSSSTSGSITDTSKTGTFTYTCTVTDGGENSVSATATYTVDYPPSGGGGILTPKEGEPTLQKSHLIVQINPGEEIIMASFGGTGIKEIQIQVSSTASNVRIKVSKYDSKPMEVSKDISGKVYRYLEISTENLGDKLEKVIVTIQVEKIWISDQGLNKEDVMMFKFDNSSEEWGELETVFDNEDDNFYIYSIELDSFSFFVIGEKVKEDIGEVGETPVTEKGFFETIREKIPIWLWWSLVFVLVVGILLVIYFIRRKREERDKDLSNNIE